jgi:hypothetical protein
VEATKAEVFRHMHHTPSSPTPIGDPGERSECFWCLRSIVVVKAGVVRHSPELRHPRLRSGIQVSAANAFSVHVGQSSRTMDPQSSWG